HPRAALRHHATRRALFFHPGSRQFGWQVAHRGGSVPGPGQARGLALDGAHHDAAARLPRPWGRTAPPGAHSGPGLRRDEAGRPLFLDPGTRKCRRHLACGAPPVPGPGHPGGLALFGAPYDEPHQTPPQAGEGEAQAHTHENDHHDDESAPDLHDHLVDDIDDIDNIDDHHHVFDVDHDHDYGADDHHRYQAIEVARLSRGHRHLVRLRSRTLRDVV